MTPSRASRAVQVASRHPEGPWVVAHRGASAVAPENTLAAYREALRLGCVAAETDVHLSLDGQVVVIHDATTLRTTGVAGRVDASTLQELQSLDAGAWYGSSFAGERLPAIGELLDLVRGRLALCVEIKAGAEVVPPLRRAIDARDMRGDIILFSFDPLAIAAARQELPECPAVLLLTASGAPAAYDAWDIKAARKAGATAVGIDAEAGRDGFLAAAHEAGFPVFVWTVDDPVRARLLRDEGVDLIISNRPDAITAALTD